MARSDVTAGLWNLLPEEWLVGPSVEARRIRGDANGAGVPSRNQLGGLPDPDSGRTVDDNHCRNIAAREHGCGEQSSDGMLRRHQVYPSY